MGIVPFYESIVYLQCLEFQDEICKCTQQSIYWQRTPYMFASPYCPKHHTLYKYRWYDKAKSIPDNYLCLYHTVIYLNSLKHHKHLKRTIHSFFRLLRKKNKSLLYFGCIHWTEAAGLHLHFGIASEVELSELRVMTAWRVTYERIVGQQPNKKTEHNPMRGTWQSNLKYILKVNYPVEHSQLPPRGTMRVLVKRADYFLTPSAGPKLGRCKPGCPTT